MATKGVDELAPGLLLAVPQLQEEFFSRAVVLMIEHNDEGSFGLVINQKSNVTAQELLENLDIAWKGTPGEHVWRGGPVSPGTGWVLHTPRADLYESDDGSSGTVNVMPNLSLSISPENLKLLASAPPEHFKLLLGYAGWGPGQLAEEVAQGSWMFAEATLDLIFNTPAEEMWDAAIKSLGGLAATMIGSSSSGGVN